jgi:hypothetical protein
MPQYLGFVGAQGRHFTIGQLYLHKATLGKRQRTHCLGWEGEMTGEAGIYNDLNVGGVTAGARATDLE